MTIKYFAALLLTSLLVLSTHLFAQNTNQLQIIKYNDLEDIIKKSSPDTLLVINFWATWCRPCIEELPAFEKLNQ